MKRISFLAILIFITGIMFSCSDSSSSDTDEGYIDPGLSAKDLSITKTYDIDSFTTDVCTGITCLSIIYKGELNNTDYVGIAVKDANDNLKIYWNASSMPATGTLTSCTVVFNGVTTTNVSIPVIVTPSTSGSLTMYKIDFGVISPVGTGITNGDTITAVAY